MLDQYIKNLDRYRDFGQDDNVELFEAVLSDIARLKDPKSKKNS